MDKISSIIPRSKRVASTDVAQSAAVRPGAPSFGRPMGSSTVGAKDSLTTADKAIMVQQQVAERRKNSAMTPDIVTEMADKFFLQHANAPALEDKSEKIPNFKPSAHFEEKAARTVDEENTDGDFDELSEEALVAQPSQKEYVPPGTYLDVNV